MAHELARLDLRLDPDIKSLAARASALAGSRNLTDFVVQAIREKAIRAIEEADVVRLNTDAFEAFRATCDNPPEPNDALKAALHRRNVRKKQSATNRGTEQVVTRPHSL